MEKRKFRNIRIEILNQSGELIPLTTAIPLVGCPSFCARHYTLIFIYKYGVDTPPTYIYKYDAVRAVLYTSSRRWRWWPRSLWHRSHLFRPTIRTAWTWYRQFSPRAMEDVRRILWSSAKSVGREALRSGTKVMTDIAANCGQTGDILSKNVTETTQNIIKKLRGGVSRKRKRASSRNPSSQRKHKAKKAKRMASSKTIKKDIFS